MSTKMSARSIVGSLRLVGVTAAVAAGIAGFAPGGAQPATTDLAVVANQTDQSQNFKAPQARQQAKLPPQVCAALLAHAPAEVVLKHGCIVIGDSGPIEGGSLF